MPSAFRIPLFDFSALIVLLCLNTACQQHKLELPQGFEIHPAFQLELVASEPLIFDPVDLEFDEKGRAFALEMPGYPLSDEAGRLILLRDENGDGIYDQRHIYADSLGVASSFMPYRGGMLVAAPPVLLWLRDTDQDDTADERVILMDGFSVGNLQHNYNGLTYGLDNWIYAANGGNSGEPFFVDQPGNKINLRGVDFRFRPEKLQIETVGRSSGGFELAFDDWGHMYETHNTRHLSHLVFPARYTEGLPTDPTHSLTNISDHEENNLARIYPIGEQETRVNHPEQSGYFSGACGVTFYGGNAFPEGFNDQLFVADVVLNLVHLDILSPDKASFKASRDRDKVEFLASSDRAFRPVNLTTGPDGALYLVDMYRNVIEHPEWIPDEIEVTLNLAAGKDKGRIYRIVPKENWTPSQLQLRNDQPDELVKALAHKNHWTRMTAQRLIVELQDKTLIPLLEELFQTTEDPLARLHTLWTLDGLGALDDDLITAAFSDVGSGLRENALKMIEGRLNDRPQLVKPVIQMTADPDARVRLQATLTLSTLTDEVYKNYAEDIRSALISLLTTQEVDIWTQMAISGAVRRDPVVFFSNILDGKPTELNEPELSVLLTLARLTGRGGNEGAGPSRELLASIHRNQSITPANKAALVEALAEGWERSAYLPGTQSTNTGVLAILSEIEQDDQPAAIRAGGRLRQAMGLPVSVKLSRQISAAMARVTDRSLPTEERLDLLQLIALEKFDKRETALYQFLDNREPFALQREALDQLSGANEPRVGLQLLKLWPLLGPEARKGAGNILLYKSHNHELLLSALEDGRIRPGELNFDLERRRVLLFSKDEKIKTRAEALFSDAGVITRREAIEKMRPALALTGDIAKGKIVYERLCSLCHQYGDLGKDVGPVLTEISRKSKESLLHDILDPNAAVDTKYLNHQIRTTDGNIYSGLIYGETDVEITLRMTGGLEMIINKTTIESLSSLGISLMPEGQEQGMTQQEMADLLAFLQQPAL